MKKALAIRAAPIFALLCGCASQPLPVEELKPDAVKAADQRAALELGCDSMTVHVLRRETIEEGQGTGWYDYPHKAAYTLQVSGCQQHRTYAVTCDERPRKNCVAGPVMVSLPPRQLADDLRPDAVKASDQRGATELACNAVTSQVLRQETIEEAQGTGWYEYPHTAAYRMNVSGCGKSATYLVVCDSRKKSCVTGAFQEKTEGGPPQLADKLAPDAMKTADQRGAAELGCEAVKSEILRQETIEEAQGTGWYEYPHRAVYSIAVTGCGKQTKYAVACNNRKRSCVAGHTLNTDSE